MCPHPMMILVRVPKRRSNCTIADFVMETQPAVGPKLSRARCKNTALPRPAVVVDLDDEIIEMVGALEPVAALLASAPDPLVVVAIPGVLAPGVRPSDDPGRQECLRPAVAVASPPQLSRPIAAPGGAAIALALVGQNAAAPERHRNCQRSGGEPAPAWITGRRLNADRRERAEAPFLSVTD